MMSGDLVTVRPVFVAADGCYERAFAPQVPDAWGVYAREGSEGPSMWQSDHASEADATREGRALARETGCDLVIELWTGANGPAPFERLEHV